MNSSRYATDKSERDDRAAAAGKLTDPQMYIGGRCRAGNGTGASIINPGTGALQARLTWASGEQAAEALEAAAAAFPEWSGMPIEERVSWLNELADSIESRSTQLLDCLMAETGKSLAGAEYDLGMLLQCLRYFAEEARRKVGEVQPDWNGRFHHLLVHQPVGVVVAYLSWNFPLLNLGYKLGPALAAGCTLVVKPSERTPLATLLVGAIAAEIGFPPGVFNLVVGEGRELGGVLSGSTIPAMITMIGSTAVGREVIASSATSIKRFSLELGGNAPVLVLADADLDEAAKEIVGLKFTNGGQVCVAPNRVFVHRQVHDQFIEAARRYTSELGLGWGREPRADVGPLISAEARDRIQGLIDEALAGGARVVCGGKRPAQPAGGFYFEPTILAGVTPEMSVAREEIFGPVLPVISFEDEREAVRLANDTPYGLAAYLFTNDYRNIFEMTGALAFGTVCVNEPHFAVYLPHGGTKESGFGKDCSHLSLDEYYRVKRISIRV